jgi:hypothetical protein
MGGGQHLALVVSRGRKGVRSHKSKTPDPSPPVPSLPLHRLHPNHATPSKVFPMRLSRLRSCQRPQPRPHLHPILFRRKPLHPSPPRFILTPLLHDPPPQKKNPKMIWTSTNKSTYNVRVPEKITKEGGTMHTSRTGTATVTERPSRSRSAGMLFAQAIPTPPYPTSSPHFPKSHQPLLPPHSPHHRPAARRQRAAAGGRRAAAKGQDEGGKRSRISRKTAKNPLFTPPKAIPTRQHFFSLAKTQKSPSPAPRLRRERVGFRRCYAVPTSCLQGDVRLERCRRRAEA